MVNNFQLYIFSNYIINFDVIVSPCNVKTINNNLYKNLRKINKNIVRYKQVTKKTNLNIFVCVLNL